MKIIRSSIYAVAAVLAASSAALAQGYYPTYNRSETSATQYRVSNTQVNTTNTNDSFYVGLSADAAFNKSSKIDNAGTSDKLNYGTNSGFNLAVGYNVAPNFRLEGEAGYHALGIKSLSSGGTTTKVQPHTDVKIMTAMANAYYDLHNSSNFTPYVGVGAGMASVSLARRVLGTSDSKSSEAAYQVMAGVGYTSPSMPSVNWLLGYRYINVSAPQFASAQNVGSSVKFGRIGMSNVELGMRYNF